MLRCPQWGLSSQSLGKYWQLNQSNQHTSTYSRIQQQTKNPYYVTIHNEYTQENPRINRQDRQTITFPGSAYPKEISQQYTPTTHTKAVYHQKVLLGVFHPVSDHWRLLDPPWGRVAKPLVSQLMPVPPLQWRKMKCTDKQTYGGSVKEQHDMTNSNMAYSATPTNNKFKVVEIFNCMS